MYVSFRPHSTLWIIYLESKRSAFESEELYSEEGWSYQIQLKLWLGRPWCDSGPNCGKPPSTMLSVMLDIVYVGIRWNMSAIWEVTYSPTLDLKSEGCIWRPISVQVTHADKLWTRGLGCVLTITTFIWGSLLSESFIFFLKSTQEWCD